MYNFRAEFCKPFFSFYFEEIQILILRIKESQRSLISLLYTNQILKRIHYHRIIFVTRINEISARQKSRNAEMAINHKSFLLCFMNK